MTPAFDPLALPEYDTDGNLLGAGSLRTMRGMKLVPRLDCPSLRSALSGDKPYPTHAAKEALYAELGRLNGLRYDAPAALRHLVPKEYRPRAPRYVAAELIDPVEAILRTRIISSRHARAFGLPGTRELGAYLVQPYMGWEGSATLDAIADDLSCFGLCAITPPDPFASIYYPGYAVSLVICRPHLAATWQWVADQAEMRTEGNFPGRYAPLLTPRKPGMPPRSWNPRDWPNDWYPRHSAWDRYGLTSCGEARYIPLKDASYG